MASEGYNIAGTGANVDGFSNPANVTTKDGVYSTSSTLNIGNSSDSVKGYNFQFSIPTGSTIDGILLRIKGRRSTNPCTLYGFMSRDNGSNWRAPTTGSAYYALTTSNAEYVFGGATDLWSETWTAEQINDNTNLNGRARANWAGEGDAIGYIDSIEITVYYTPPAGYGHDVNEVLATNIAKVSEVLTADIAKINET